MIASGDSENVAVSGDAERRVSAHLREVFEQACRITEPFFDAQQTWGGVPMTLYAQQALHQAYPELTKQDVAILFSAVRRFHAQTGRPASPPA